MAATRILSFYHLTLKKLHCVCGFILLKFWRNEQWFINQPISCFKGCYPYPSQHNKPNLLIFFAEVTSDNTTGRINFNNQIDETIFHFLFYFIIFVPIFSFDSNLRRSIFLTLFYHSFLNAPKNQIWTKLVNRRMVKNHHSA